jgi:Tfp pilus assembly protein PilN
MIEINLLPEELKSKAKKSEEERELNQILYFVPLLFGILLVIHLSLAAVFVFRAYQISILNAKWRSLEPQRKLLSQSQQEYDLLSQDSRIAQQLDAGRISWAQKIKRLSADLPPGIWFNEAVFSSKECILKGSVISLKKEEMSLINRLISNLKTDVLFFKDFGSLELSSVQMRSIGGYNVVDFVLTAKPKGS